MKYFTMFILMGMAFNNFAQDPDHEVLYDIGVEENIPPSLAGRNQAEPIVRISPNYPAQALRDGIEGYVIVGYSITEVGSVTDIEILYAEPKRVFDRSAKQALNKWKFKPKFVDGVPIKQPNKFVQLDFKMEQ